MAIVVFVGPDGSGKTTIVRSLLDRLDCLHYKGTHEDPEHITRVFTNAVDQARHDRIMLCDRLHYPDDLIYSRVIKGIPSPLEFVEACCESVLRKCDTILIYVTARIEALQKRFGARGDDYVNIDQLKVIQQMYIDYLLCTHLPWYIIDTTWRTPEIAVCCAERIIEGRWPNLYKEAIKLGKA